IPNLEDRGSLDFVDAILMEIQRWRPVVPGGIAHRSREDDIYKGIFIPKGTMIIPNTIGILYNREEFPEPEVFNPYRFLTSKGNEYTLRKGVHNPLDTAFGYGPRICPGRHFATSWLWLAIATILTVFDISPEVDAAGNDILPDLEYVPVVVRYIFRVSN
ncbi:cytochrome P450, partial [Sistotremastrum suecicum HHB10207 ss-3]